MRLQVLLRGAAKGGVAAEVGALLTRLNKAHFINSKNGVRCSLLEFRPASHLLASSSSQQAIGSICI